MANTPHEHLFTTSVTVEDQLKGRLAYINRHRNNARLSAQGHVAHVQTVFYFRLWNILPYTEDANTIFGWLKAQRIRIGSQDLRIAAIALLQGFTLVTRNVHDFAQVPNLNVEDWSIVSQ